MRFAIVALTVVLTATAGSCGGVVEPASSPPTAAPQVTRTLRETFPRTSYGSLRELAKDATLVVVAELGDETAVEVAGPREFSIASAQVGRVLKGIAPAALDVKLDPAWQWPKGEPLLLFLRPSVESTPSADRWTPISLTTFQVQGERATLVEAHPRPTFPSTVLLADVEAAVRP